MFLAILYVGAGVYLLLMPAGLLHRERMRGVPGPARFGIAVMGIAFVFLGLFHALRLQIESASGRGPRTEEVRETLSPSP